ncbi:hypothetical protein HDF26_001953 [Pedobacter cryoconitis]|uniref:hypothetical protein n=1 Tax=Pedobacter cryoconitis TaxID=188932 RepID=UPI00160C501D|nr:hypothetical protein [Pedobacter cryoconitis]MBB6271526.1 hypothetical protein [Pedobacter cryoconitis]
MNFNKYRIIYCVIFTLIVSKVNAQSELLPLGHDLNNKLGKEIYFNNSKRIHTSLLPYIVSDIDSSGKDSLLKSVMPLEKDWQSKNWLFRKIFQQHLVEVNDKDYSFYLDFLPDLQIGRQGGNTTWLNTRGIEIGGKIGKQFSFTSHFYENQGKFARYITDYITTNRVVPGQGYAKLYGKGGFDYAYSGGTLSYTPSKYLNVQLGYDKNFIGDGYRSLLLSDNSFNYPFLKVTATLGSVRYMAMWAQFIDLYDTPFDDETPYPKKYGLFHYLSWNATKRLSLGLFENIMWRPRGFDFSYVNPVMFMRPTEYANGSPDKALLGLNASYKIADRYVAYGQLMINEFTFKEVFANTGYWANKQGGQLGIKGFDIFKVSNLSAQLEMNRVRPYSYSASDHYKNYGHYNQSLAHPYGANFKEYLAIVNYRYKRFDARLQLTTATYGLDINGLNYGKDIYKPYTTRVDDYGVNIGHGLKTDLLFTDLKIGYLLNPKNNLRLEVGGTYRKETNSQFNDKQRFFTIGLRSSFRNIYTDF